MAIQDNIDLTLSANMFKAYTIADADSIGSGTNRGALTKDNLETYRMMKDVYHFAQTKVDILPRLYYNQGDYSADFMTYHRVSKAGWTEKKKAGEETPFQEQTRDKRASVGIILHTATREDLDLKRKNEFQIVPQMQLEWTYALSRHKERLAQYAATAPVIQLATDVKAGFQGAVTSSEVSFPDSQRRVLTSTSGTLRPAPWNGVEASKADDHVDQLVTDLEGANLDLDKQVVVVPHLVRLQLKKIASFRNLESNVNQSKFTMKGENATIMPYKDLLWVFLKPDAYLNRKTDFNGKIYGADGRLKAAATSSDKTLAADLSAAAGNNLATALIIDVGAMGWGADSGANVVRTGSLELNSFADVIYMKTGFAAGRKDELKVRQYLFDTRTAV